MAEQHVQVWRKIQLRRSLLRWASEGAAYVPFIGDGDLAAELYSDRRIYGADLDEQRVEVARERLARCEIIVADCDGWPFPQLDDPIALADFDAYVYPYPGFRAFWRDAPKADRLVLYFTDGARMPLMLRGIFTSPDGTTTQLSGLDRWRTYNTYWWATYQWFEAFVAPWRVLDRFRYLRGPMVYWGAVIEQP